MKHKPKIKYIKLDLEKEQKKRDKEILLIYKLIIKIIKRKLKELELALSKAEEEREIAYSKYSKLRDKTIRILDSITKIENKYSYTRRIKVLNPNYAGNQ